MPYRRHYRTYLADTFDIYLSILRTVNQRVKKALGQDAPDWRAKNSCPACNYVVSAGGTNFPNFGS